MFEFLKRKKFRSDPPYEPIGRKLLLVDKSFKKDQIPRYKKPLNAKAHIIPRRGAVPDRVMGDENEVLVPTFELATLPQRRILDTVKLKDIKRLSKDAISKLEDTEIITCINAAVRRNQTVWQSGDISLCCLSYAFGVIQSNNLKVDKVVMHPRQFADLVYLGKDLKNTSILGRLRRRFLKIHGYIWGAKILVSNRVPEGYVYVLPAPEYIGVLVVKKDFTKVRCDDIKNFKKGWMFFESIGICVLDDANIAKIELTSTS